MPERIQLSRTKGYRKPEGAIVVSRPSRWGNPWVVGTGQVTVQGRMVGSYAGNYDTSDTRSYDVVLRDGITAEEAVALYRDDLEASLADPDSHYDELRAAVAELRDKDLACWCALTDACHAAVLIELANA